MRTVPTIPIPGSDWVDFSSRPDKSGGYGGLAECRPGFGPSHRALTSVLRESFVGDGGRSSLPLKPPKKTTCVLR